MIRDDDLRKAVEGIVTTTNVISSSISLNNGDTDTTIITVTNSGGAKILGVIDLTLYQTSIDGSNDTFHFDKNQIPGGSNVTTGNWSFIGPWNDWGTTNNSNLKTAFYLKNVSNGTTTVLIRGFVRTITNTLTLQQTSS